MDDKTREILLDVRSTILIFFDTLQIVSSTLDEKRVISRQTYLNALTIVLIYIAGADGPINMAEAEVINLVLGEAHSVSYLNLLRRDFCGQPEMMRATISVLEVAMFVSAIAIEEAKGEDYTAASDRVVKLIALMGQAAVAADDDADEAEVAALSEITGRLRDEAIEIERLRNTDKDQPEKPKVEKPKAASRPRPVAEAPSQTESTLTELHKLVGLDSVKLEVETLANLGKVFSLRKEKGLAVPPYSFHLVFSGNPGTGKTTVARLIGKVYGQLGLLSKGHVVEVDRSGLVANYIGQTANKVKAVIESSLGGVLFIDEAYALSPRSSNDFGAEAIETLLKGMEDHRDDLVVIAAGYSDEMQAFLQTNPGLRSRFGKTIEFPDYSAAEMVEIFHRLAEGAHYDLNDEAADPLGKELTRRWEGRGRDFANARDVRGLFEAVIAAQANRISALSKITNDDLRRIEAGDIIAAVS
jgi:SpoVK/Ycf46/Vps4 family AAA+-type ATPase